MNGGELGTEVSIFVVPAAVATVLYVIWFLPAHFLIGKDDIRVYSRVLMVRNLS